MIIVMTVVKHSITDDNDGGGGGDGDYYKC